MERNIQVKQSALSVENSRIALDQSKNNRLPNLNASMSDGFSFGQSQGRDGVYADQNTNTANGSLNTSVPLFQGLRIYNDIQVKQFNLMAASQDQDKVKNDLSLNIASLYLTVLIQKELVKNAKAQMTLTESLEKQTEALVNSGRESQAKLYEIRAQKANEQYAVTNAEKNLKLAVLDLAQTLELENGVWFDIEEPNMELDIRTMDVPIVVFDEASNTLPNIKAEQYRLDGAKKALNVTKADYFPRLSLGASTSTSYYYLLNTDNLNDPFSKQLSNNWRSAVNLSLSIPIFNRFEVRNSMNNSKIQISQQEMQLESAKKALFKDIQRAILNANSSKERYIAANLSMQANQESYRYIEERFSSGKATTFELQKSKTDFANSLSERIQAKYEFLFNVKILDFYKGNDISL
ncbi:transporter [Bacteroidia bacterium]|nr:transporter [Bacteroidia bacterium]